MKTPNNFEDPLVLLKIETGF